MIQSSNVFNNEVEMNKTKIIELLNDILKGEFITVNQYWLYGLTLNHQSLGKLGKIFIEESTEEREHVEKLSKRILQLGGVPDFRGPTDIDTTPDVERMFEVGIVLEETIINKYQQAIAQLEDMHDYASVEILSGILKDEEGHREWLQAQLELLKRIGLQLYLSKIMTLEMQESE